MRILAAVLRNVLAVQARNGLLGTLGFPEIASLGIGSHRLGHPAHEQVLAEQPLGLPVKRGGESYETLAAFMDKLPQRFLAERIEKPPKQKGRSTIPSSSEGTRMSLILRLREMSEPVSM